MDVIITGSTGGIGSCILKHTLASQEVEKIYCQYRNREKFLALAGQENFINLFQKLVNTENGNIEHILQELYQHTPRDIACICTSFSITPIKRVGTYTWGEVQDNISANVLDMVSFVNSVLRYRQDCGSSLRIINIDSGAAYKPLEGWALYCAAKAYTNMFLKTVQLENPEVKVVSYEPGVVDTPMQEQIREVDESVFDQVSIFREYHENGQLRSPDIIAEDIVRRFVEDWNTTGFTGGYGR